MTGRFTRRRPLAVGFVVLAAGLALAGCGSSDATVTETRDGRITVEGEGDRRTATIQGDGSSTVFGSGTTPKGFPGAVPLPKGATLGTTASATRVGTQFFQLNYSGVGATAAKALDAYGAQLTGAGFDVTPGTGRSIEATDGTWRVRAVAGAGSDPTLAVTVTNAGG